MARYLRWYGANPLHLLVLVCSLAVTGYACVRLFAVRPVGVAIWLVGAAVLHDLILLPLYSLADLSARSVLRHRARAMPGPAWINHLRVPAFLSGVLLLVWFPLILRLPAPYPGATGLTDALPRPVAGRHRRPVRRFGPDPRPPSARDAPVTTQPATASTKGRAGPVTRARGAHRRGSTIRENTLPPATFCERTTGHSAAHARLSQNGWLPGQHFKLGQRSSEPLSHPSPIHPRAATWRPHSAPTCHLANS